jgi:hypothetical protein
VGYKAWFCLELKTAKVGRFKLYKVMDEWCHGLRVRVSRGISRGFSTRHSINVGCNQDGRGVFLRVSNTS